MDIYQVNIITRIFVVLIDFLFKGNGNDEKVSKDYLLLILFIY